MPSVYPTGIDSWIVKVASQGMMAADVNNLQDAMSKLQRKVGIDVSASDHTLDYKVNNFMVEGSTLLYFYENSAPTGWVASAVAGDCVLGVGGYAAGAQAFFASAVTVVGTWGLGDNSLASHNHKWVRAYAFVYNYSYRPDGSQEQYGVYGGNQKGTGMCTSITKGDSWVTKDAFYTDMDGHYHTYSNSWRPKTALGILAVYEGS